MLSHCALSWGMAVAFGILLVTSLPVVAWRSKSSEITCRVACIELSLFASLWLLGTGAHLDVMANTCDIFVLRYLATSVSSAGLTTVAFVSSNAFVEAYRAGASYRKQPGERRPIEPTWFWQCNCAISLLAGSFACIHRLLLESTSM